MIAYGRLYNMVVVVVVVVGKDPVSLIEQYFTAFAGGISEKPASIITLSNTLEVHAHFKPTSLSSALAPPSVTSHTP